MSHSGNDSKLRHCVNLPFEVIRGGYFSIKYAPSYPEMACVKLDIISPKMITGCAPANSEMEPGFLEVDYWNLKMLSVHINS